MHLARLTGWFLLLAYVVLILSITLGQHDAGYHALNLRPGRSIWLELHDVDPWIGVANVVGNLVMFAPLGFLLVTAVGDGIRRAALGGALLSATIECCQHQVGRSADIDDVLLNTVGGLIGALAGVGALWLLRRRPVRRAVRRLAHHLDAWLPGSTVRG